MKSNQKEIEREKLLDQEELIDFYYIDKESHTKILVHDKRKIKVALLEMDEYERKLKNDIMENECPYNQRTDDPIDETQDFEYQASQFELDLEDALQEMANKISSIYDKSKNISKYFQKHIQDFTEKQLLIIFIRYYLNFSITEISQILGTAKSTISAHIDRIEAKFKKFAQEDSEQKPLI
ncbi:MAG: hypothetical protein NC087_05325 [Anaeroplasma bactoclasticum]|nr:hypothetical protein [Anaeroplasma bactoclasticum]